MAVHARHCMCSFNIIITYHDSIYSPNHFTMEQIDTNLFSHCLLQATKAPSTFHPTIKMCVSVSRLQSLSAIYLPAFVHFFFRSLLLYCRFFHSFVRFARASVCVCGGNKRTYCVSGIFIEIEKQNSTLMNSEMNKRDGQKSERERKKKMS